MARGDQINLHPHFKGEGPTLPCEGAVGDLYVFTDLDEGAPDPSRPFRVGTALLLHQGDGRGALGGLGAGGIRRSNDLRSTSSPPPHYTELKDR
jgi:hypothetical protein